MSNELLSLAEQVIAPIIKRFTPLVLESGRGSCVYDDKGVRYLDFVSGIGANTTGHCHPRVVAAVQEQAGRLIHVSQFLAAYESNIVLAAKLADLVPGEDNTVFFSNSGAEAVEGAIKLARHYTGRQALVAFRQGFHGRTLAATVLSTSKAKYNKGYQGVVGGIHFATYAYCYRCAFNAKPGDCRLECLNQLEHMFMTEVYPGDVAAIIVEPVQGEGGYIVPPQKFMVKLREIADQHNILLIFDEIQTGFGRTGKMFACEHFGVVPDITTVAKGIASGFPLSAVVARRQIMEAWTAGAHGGTYGGNPVSCAAGVATLETIEAEGLLDNACKQGRYMIDRLDKLKEQYPQIGDVRGLGLMVGIEFINSDGSPDGELVKRILQEALQRKLILFPCGPYENVIRLIPPLTVSREEIDEALNITEASLAAALAGELKIKAVAAHGR